MIVCKGIVEEGNDPYFLKPVMFRKNEKKPNLTVNNVNYLDDPIRKSLFNDYDSYNDDLQQEHKCFSDKKVVIEEDIEEWVSCNTF